MIEQLRISGLGVIDDASLELAPGFNVVTGETGAGKTMVVTGLGLLLGQRADTTRVRSGATRAQVEGVVRLPAAAADEVRRRVDEAGGTCDDDTLVLVRSIGAAGRSRAAIGGAAAPVALLAELGEALVAVHGQADQQLLRSGGFQREVLDRFGGPQLLRAREQVGGAYARWRDLQADLAQRVAGRRDRALEADALRLGLEQVDAVAPQHGEDESLSAEAARLGHADTLRGAADLAHVALTGESSGGVGDGAPAGEGPDVLTLLGQARNALAAAAGHDPQLDALAARVDELAVLAADVAGDLASYGDGVDTDPARLAVVEERRAALASLTRRYGPALSDVLAWADAARRRLVELDDSDDRIESLRAELRSAQDELVASCHDLSRRRAKAGKRLATSVTAELAGLAMPHASLQVALACRPDDDGIPWQDGESVAVGPHGVDDVELQLVPHPGSAALPLARAASGGELSRVMLAVEVVLADDDPVGTFVFDEVDAGVGGSAAIEVGRRLAQLARHRQVVVVTHLPQVAAFADRHFVVIRGEGGEVTASGVHAVVADQRRDELARMLAGLGESSLGRAHAEELIDLAARERADATAVPKATVTT